MPNSYIKTFPKIGEKMVAKKNILEPVSKKEHRFVLLTGKEIKSLEELEAALEIMSGSVFRHHVTEYRNDFANWIKDILKDDDLALQIYKEKSLRKILQIIKVKRKKLQKELGLEVKNKAIEHYSIRRISRPPKEHEYLRGKHEHIKYRISEFIYGVIFGAVLMLIAMRIFGLI